MTPLYPYYYHVFFNINKHFIYLGFLFWFLDDLGATKLEMGWTVTIGMLSSLPFLIFSGPITDTVGHINVIILGMVAYTVR